MSFAPRSLAKLKSQPLYTPFMHFLKILIAVSIIAWLLASGKIDLYAIRHVFTLKSLIICWGALFLSYLLTSYRWKILLETQGVNISVKDAFRLNLVGVFFSFVLPGGLSGDIVKAYYVTREAKSKHLTTGVSIVLDRFIGMSGLILLSFVMVLVDWKDVVREPRLITMQLLLGFIFLICVFLAMVIFSERTWGAVEKFLSGIDVRIGAKPMRFFAACHAYGEHRLAIIRCFGFTMASHVMSIILFVHVGDITGEAVPLAAYFYCVPIGFIFAAIPLAPGGIGVGQAAFYFVFNLYLGRVTDLGPTLVTVYQLLTFTFGLAGAIYYLQIKKRVSFASTEAQITEDSAS